MDEKKRWDELADLLGLSGGSAPAAKPTPAAPPPPPRAPEPPREEPAAEQVEVEEFEDEEIEEIDSPSMEVVPADEVIEPTETAAPARGEEDEDRPRRGRRRRRRGRRRGGERDGDEPRAETPRPETPRPERDRPQPVEEEVDEFGDEEEVEDEPRPVQASIPEEDLDFSDWSVPSWQEIVSSLYRP